MRIGVNFLSAISSAPCRNSYTSESIGYTDYQITNSDVKLLVLWCECDVL